MHTKYRAQNAEKVLRLTYRRLESNYLLVGIKVAFNRSKASKEAPLAEKFLEDYPTIKVPFPGGRKTKNFPPFFFFSIIKRRKVAATSVTYFATFDNDDNEDVSLA